MSHRAVIEPPFFCYAETSALKPGRLHRYCRACGFRPRHAPAFISITPSISLPGPSAVFYFSLMPAVVRRRNRRDASIVGSLVVAALTVAGAVIVVALRNGRPRPVLR